MALLKNVTECSTSAVKGLDNQLTWQMNKLQPNLLVKIDDLHVKFDDAVHPWLQAPAKSTLKSAITDAGKAMTINSAFRTLAGQMLLRLHYENGRCDIKAAAQPGGSNHNNASAIDVEDADSWQSALESNHWEKLGNFDPMHYDCVDSSIKHLKEISVKAFQTLWNLANPHDTILVDGDFGDSTRDKLLNSPAEGFGDLEVPRILCLTSPNQQGKDVAKLQLALRNEGIKLNADEFFGKNTQDAVILFQKTMGITSDGKVGDETRKLLKL